jgi:hypothetical protein
MSFRTLHHDRLSRLSPFAGRGPFPSTIKLTFGRRVGGCTIIPLAADWAQEDETILFSG